MTKTKEKDLKTEVELSDYKGSPLLTIWELEDDGTRKQFPVMAFGMRKAREIVKHMDAIKEFVGE